jgi:hypothetical protein
MRERGLKSPAEASKPGPSSNLSLFYLFPRRGVEYSYKISKYPFYPSGDIDENTH